LGCFGLKLFDSFYITHMTLFHSDPVSSAEEAEGMIVIERTYAITTVRLKFRQAILTH
jgi:hypothetical protein